MSKAVLPKTIRIGPKYFKVSRVLKVHHPRGIPCDGMINHSTNVIEVWSKIRGNLQLETLIHEVLHGVATQMDVPLSEKKVNWLAYGLTQVLLDNPELVDLIDVMTARRTARRKKG